MPVVSRGVLEGDALSGHHDPFASHRRAPDHRLARDLEGARRDQARPAALPRRPCPARSGRGRRALGRRDPPGRCAADPLERDQARPQAAPLVPRRREDRRPARAGRGDRRADHRRRASDQRRDRRRGRSRPRRLPGLARPHRRLDRGRRSGRRPSQRCRLPDRICARPRDDHGRPAARRSSRRPAGQLPRSLVPDFPGKVPPILPAEWLEPLQSS